MFICCPDHSSARSPSLDNFRAVEVKLVERYIKMLALSKSSCVYNILAKHILHVYLSLVVHLKFTPAGGKWKHVSGQIFYLATPNLTSA